MKKFSLILIFVIFLLVLAAGAALFFIPDQTLKTSLATVPHLSTYAQAILKLKSRIMDLEPPAEKFLVTGKSEFFGFNFFYSTPRIIINLEALENNVIPSPILQNSVSSNTSPSEANTPSSMAQNLAQPLKSDGNLEEGNEPPNLSNREKVTQSKSDETVNLNQKTPQMQEAPSSDTKSKNTTATMEKKR